MKKILIPVDFGSYAENAFVYALRLADSIKAEIHLLHVIPPSNIDSSPFLIRPYAELLKSAKSRMQHFYHNGINVSSSFLKNRPKVSNTVRGGDLREIVNDVIRDHQFDLMIMGTKGRMDDWNNVFGSTTAHLIKK
ncbi:MAG: universal stress protein, partial [Bacteroidota bacterium]